MNKVLFHVATVFSTTLAVIVLSTQFAWAAPKNYTQPTNVLLGNDISWPQCFKKLPTDQNFGIVGVNDGLANNTNPCLSTELSWATKSSGGTGQPLVQLYVNTANPAAQGSWWPTSNTYGGAAVSNPYGTCTAGNYGAACAYMYGYAKAYDDATTRGVNNPGSYTWWLDVETGNTWQSDKTANTADLEGMVNYFHAISARVGLYSTNYQWNQIVGTISSGSPLNNLKSWLAGATSSSSAQSLCKTGSPLTSGSPVVLTQFVSRNLDYDYSCI